MEGKFLEGIIDTHVHSAPDVRKRKMTDYELMQAAVERKVRALVIKSHLLPTAARAADMNEVCQAVYGKGTEFEMFGGITLNRYVGGINPWAVETVLQMGGKVVWLPTFDSEQTLKDSDPEHAVICVKDGAVVPALEAVMRLVRDYDVALATSHISPYDIFKVVEKARAVGVKKLIISHPESRLVGLTWEEQKRLVRDYDVMLERCYAQPIGGGVYKKNLEDTYRAFCEIGSSNMIIATDAGQTQNPYWYESYEESVRYMAERGVSGRDLEQMTKTNPAKMLGI